MTANEFLLKLRNTTFMLSSGNIPLFINGSQVENVTCSIEGEGANIRISMTVKNQSIKKGDRFLCIDTVAMNNTKKIAYIKDKEYISEMDTCITDEQGIKSHHWDEKVGVWDYFMKLNN